MGGCGEGVLISNCETGSDCGIRVEGAVQEEYALVLSQGWWKHCCTRGRMGLGGLDGSCEAGVVSRDVGFGEAWAAALGGHERRVLAGDEAGGAGEAGLSTGLGLDSSELLPANWAAAGKGLP